MSSTSPKKRKLSTEKSEDLINLSFDSSQKRSKIEEITLDNSSIVNQNNDEQI